ncbi:hypothetical protein EMCRGX_G026155 [Ephydatia muelleri]
MSETELDSDKDPYGHPRIPLRGLYDVNSCNLRRQWAEKFANCTLDQVGTWWPNEGRDDSCSCLKLKGNIENPIGLAKVPVGLVGPLLVKGKSVAGYVLCPFATTEGALVASATRGASALMRSGGVFVSTEDQVMTRAPSFTFASAKEAESFWTWLRGKLDDLKQQVRQYSQHAELVSLSPQRFGRTLVVQFKYCTRDAAGQNMVTGATSHLCKWLLGKAEKEMEGVRVARFHIESNLSCDKKLAMLNLFQTIRGIHVQAEAWVPDSVLQSVLKVDGQSLLDTYQHFIHSSFRVGAIGFNINVSNILAAVFIATGQDVASVVESSTCQLILAPATKEEIEQAMKGAGEERPASCRTEGGVYACLVMPSLILGTVGGGTGLATQKECLQLMGCYGTGGVGRLAEIIVGFALGLELSTLASVCSGQFASAHEKLGRKHPQNGLKGSHIGPELFTGLMGDGWTFICHTPFTVSSGNSILTELTRVEISKMVGHFGFEVTYKSRESTGVQQTVKMVLKAKPTDVETCNMLNKIAQGCGLQLAVNYEKFKMQTGFRYTHSREVELCQLDNKSFKQYLPRVYKVLYDPSKEVHAILMEYLDQSNTCLLDCADDITGWQIEDIKVVLRDMASIHTLFLDQEEWLSSREWLERMSSDKMTKMSPLWHELVRHAHQEFPETWTDARAAIVDMAIQNISTIWSILDPLPHTLSHNDFNPRNICLRLAPQEGSSSQPPTQGVPYPDPRRLCIYDWELACIDVPQHDLAELLAFTLAPSASKETVLELVEFYRQHLEYYSRKAFPKERWVW